MRNVNARLLSALGYFESCGRLLSFSEAAREHFVTTGAISQQIRKLEERLGFKLFIRASNGIQLTVEGKELLAVTSRSLEALQSVLDRLQQRLAYDGIRLHSTPSLVFKWLVPQLQAFHQDVPDIKVETFADAALLDLTNEDFDLAIDYGWGDYKDFQAELLMPEVLFPVMSPDYHAAFDWRDPAAWADVSLLHDAMPWPGAPRDAEWRYWFDRVGLTTVDSHQGHYFNRSDMAVAAAVAGLGIALARGALVQQELANGSLLAPFPLVDSCCRYYLITPRNSSGATKAAVLKKWMLSQAKIPTGPSVSKHPVS